MVENSTHSEVIQNAKPAHNGETLILFIKKEWAISWEAQILILEFVPRRDLIFN